MKKKKFRIYGKDKDKLWKLIWVTQGPNKDIQSGSHIANGKSYTSIHKDGNIHVTNHFNGVITHDSRRKMRWPLKSFEYIDYISSGGISKEGIKQKELTKRIDDMSEIFLLDITKFDKEINFWQYIVAQKSIDIVLKKIKSQCPGVLFAYPKNFDPTLLTVIFDPNKHKYGKELTIKARDNSVKMISPPEFSFQFQVEKKDI